MELKDTVKGMMSDFSCAFALNCKGTFIMPTPAARGRGGHFLYQFLPGMA